LLCSGLATLQRSIVKSMSSVTDISSSERERIRLGFYRAYRAQDGVSSVGVRRDRLSVISGFSTSARPRRWIYRTAIADSRFASST